MIKLDRSRVKAPGSWARAVKKAFPDEDAFRRRAADFEALGIDDPVRRSGFRSYAPEVLPRKRGKTGSCDFRAIWGRAKAALAAMSHRKCAYCESPISAERSAAVEHFRPKALFPSLVYDWDNYLLGCGGCNGAKADRWPAGGGAYVRPDGGDDPAMFLIFREDGSVEASPAVPEAAWTIEDLELNREWLRDWRAREIRGALAELADLTARPEIPIEIRARLAGQILARYLDPEQPYSAAIRQCLLRVLERELPSASS